MFCGGSKNRIAACGISLFLGTLILTGFKPDQILRALLPDSQACEPYLAHGFLVESDTPHQNRWTPFGSCHSPALLASLTKASWAVAPPAVNTSLGYDFVNEPSGPDGRPWINMEWARGRTILSAGDSIGRWGVKDFCDMTGGVFEAVEPGSKLWPQTDPRFLGNSGRYGHNGHVCMVESLDFLIIHIHTFGMDEIEYFSGYNSYWGPYQTEERFAFLAMGIVDSYRKMGRRTEPDLVLLHSGLWDAARWLREDTESASDLSDPLTPERLHWYVERLRTVDSFIQKLLPNTARRWQTVHYPIADNMSSWFFLDQQDKQATQKQRPRQRLNRLTQMNAAVRYMISSSTDEHLGIMDWGEVIKGTERRMRDDIHPAGYPAFYVWADMLLFELRRAVL